MSSSTVEEVLTAELQRFEKLLLENDQLRKKFLKFRNGCTTSKTEEESLVDMKTINQIAKLYKDACSSLIKTQSTLNLCIEKIEHCGSMKGGTNNSGKNLAEDSVGSTERVRKKLRTSSAAVPLPPATNSPPSLKHSNSSTSTSSVLLTSPSSSTKLHGRKSSLGGNEGQEEDMISPGEQVAAQIAKSKKPSEWILARVVRYLKDKKKYEIEDEYEDSGDEGKPNSGKKRYQLPRQNLIRLPKEGDLDQPEFPKDSTVLAVFPSTSTFYPAIVAVPPRKRKGEYLLKFADDEDEGTTPLRKVPVHHVVALPKPR